jgi:hypothetical protein
MLGDYGRHVETHSNRSAESPQIETTLTQARHPSSGDTIMKNVYLALALLMTVFGMLLAQERPASAHPSDQKDQATVRGCLKSSSNGFALTSDSATTYELMGDPAQLSPLISKEIEVKGLRGSASDVSTGQSGQTGAATSNSTDGTAPILRLSSATRISDHCGK